MPNVTITTPSDLHYTLNPEIKSKGTMKKILTQFHDIISTREIVEIGKVTVNNISSWSVRQEATKRGPPHLSLSLSLVSSLACN
jgi:hypothetical protein